MAMFEVEKKSNLFWLIEDQAYFNTSRNAIISWILTEPI